jgi:hypothetical protein
VVSAPGPVSGRDRRASRLTAVGTADEGRIERVVAPVGDDLVDHHAGRPKMATTAHAARQHMLHAIAGSNVSLVKQNVRFPTCLEHVPGDIGVGVTCGTMPTHARPDRPNAGDDARPVS